MNIQHPHTQPGRRGACLRDRIGDVVKLEVQKDIESALDHPTHGFGAGDDEHFLADLQRAGVRVEPVGQCQRVHRVGEVEGDDDAGCGEGHGHLNAKSNF